MDDYPFDIMICDMTHNCVVDWKAWLPLNWFEQELPPEALALHTRTVVKHIVQNLFSQAKFDCIPSTRHGGAHNHKYWEFAYIKANDVEATLLANQCVFATVPQNMSIQEASQDPQVRANLLKQRISSHVEPSSAPSKNRKI